MLIDTGSIKKPVIGLNVELDAVPALKISQLLAEPEDKVMEIVHKPKKAIILTTYGKCIQQLRGAVSEYKMRTTSKD